MSDFPDTEPNFFDRLAAVTGELQSGSTSDADGAEEIAADESLSSDDVDDNSASSASGKGRLSPELRRALVELMRSGVVLASVKPQVYELLCRHHSLIEDHLADMYLRLLIDQPAGVVLLLQQQDQADFEDEEERSALISRRTLSLYDTLLLLVLRKHYQERQSVGEHQVIIDIDRIESQLAPFLPLTNSSRSDRRKLSGAITKMKEKKLLSSVRGDDERLEITPVIRYVVSAEFLERMLAEYQSLVGEIEGDEVP
ncbi:DUF4194 domain-containing protein [Pseudomonadota bacterium]